LFFSMIIGVLQQKGGAGKTTLALNLAAYFSRHGKRTLLVDADPQGSALAWSHVRQLPPLFPVIGMPKPTLHKELPAVSADYALTIIDGAPRVNDLGRSAILASDFILIPAQPSPFDIWSCSDIVGLIREAQTFKPEIDAAFVINRRIANTAIARDVISAFDQYEFPVLASSISQRVSFAEAAAIGLTVYETPARMVAGPEISALAKEILSLQQKRKAA
jgi:chromosome partitioning protein